ncbi:hypothetical protein ACWGE0_15440 [Lentzea sp. NPDC054927]
MTSMLPPTRDLPPGRHTQIRAELERQVSGRRGSSRFTVPILAAAAVVAVVAVGVVVFRPGATEHTPAVHITTSPAPVRETFGLAPEQVEAIEQGCAKEAKVTDKLTLYQHGRDETGRWAFLYTDKAWVSCDIGRGGEEYDTSGPQEVYVDWLAGHFSLDAGGSRPGGDTHPFRPALAGVGGYRILAGRVDSSVASVTYRASDGRTAEAKIANGTFVVRIPYPSTWDGSEGNGTSELRVLDAAGNLLGTAGESEKCWTMPGVKETLPDHRDIDLVQNANNKCEPAPRWKSPLK